MPRRSTNELREVIRDFRRDQIVDVARRLFGERETVDVSMDDIASEAGVARSTVYVYFSNRDELVRACVSRMYQLLQESIVRARDGRGEVATARLRSVVRGLLERIDEDQEFFRLAIATQASHTNVGRAVDTELSLIGFDMAVLIEEVVVQGIGEGVFRDIDAGLATALIGQQLYGAMVVRASDPDRRSLDVATDEVCDFVLNGLVSTTARGAAVLDSQEEVDPER